MLSRQRSTIRSFALSTQIIAMGTSQAISKSGRWTKEAAWAWQRAQPWRCGFNYLPGSAVNSTEMWQAETFDLPTIERELNWAQQIGFNSCRVFLQYLVWEDDAQGFLSRLEQFLQAAHERSLTTILILFDDCAFAGREPYLGPQDAPVAGVHNSGWTPSPGRSRVVDEQCWPRLKQYVQGIIGTFRSDTRVQCWDLYNEPGNNNTGDESLPLLQACFAWAREAAPSQPLTAGVWNRESTACDEFVCEVSDILKLPRIYRSGNHTGARDATSKFRTPAHLHRMDEPHSGQRFPNPSALFSQPGNRVLFLGLNQWPHADALSLGFAARRAAA